MSENITSNKEFESIIKSNLLNSSAPKINDVETTSKESEVVILSSSTNKTSNIINPEYSLDSSVSLGATNIEKVTELATDFYNSVKTNVNTSSKKVSNSTTTNSSTVNINTIERVTNETTVSTLIEKIKNGDVKSGFNTALQTLENAFNDDTNFAMNIITNAASELFSGLSQVITADKIGTDGNAANSEDASVDVDSVVKTIGKENTSKFTSTLGGIAAIIADGLADYQDGVSETTFGSRMENSWFGSDTTAFLNYFKSANAKVSLESRRKINILNSTPLDSGSMRESLYGSMMLGTPFLFNEYSDPVNRTLINSLIKDGRFVSFTPGLPKFNGTSYTASKKNNILEQTATPTSMLNYLTKNGIDRDFADKDKRYYTFKTDYKDYFAYLETMLNVVWIKMGLAKNGQTFNLFSFFNIKSDGASGGIEASNYDKLIEKYNSSIGFFANVANAVSESISNNPSSDGDSLASRANQNAQEYQAMNYITGMGTGGATNNATRKIGIGLKSMGQIKGLLGETLSGTIEAINNVSTNGGRNYGCYSNSNSSCKNSNCIS